jgi:hypothetical protein
LAAWDDQGRIHLRELDGTTWTEITRDPADGDPLQVQVSADRSFALLGPDARGTVEVRPIGGDAATSRISATPGAPVADRVVAAALGPSPTTVTLLRAPGNLQVWTVDGRKLVDRPCPLGDASAIRVAPRFGIVVAPEYVAAKTQHHLRAWRWFQASPDAPGSVDLSAEPVLSRDWLDGKWTLDHVRFLPDDRGVVCVSVEGATDSFVQVLDLAGQSVWSAARPTDCHSLDLHPSAPWMVMTGCDKGVWFHSTKTNWSQVAWSSASRTYAATFAPDGNAVAFLDESAAHVLDYDRPGLRGWITHASQVSIDPIYGVLGRTIVRAGENEGDTALAAQIESIRKDGTAPTLIENAMFAGHTSAGLGIVVGLGMPLSATLVGPDRTIDVARLWHVSHDRTWLVTGDAEAPEQWAGTRERELVLRDATGSVRSRLTAPIRYVEHVSNGGDVAVRDDEYFSIWWRGATQLQRIDLPSLVGVVVAPTGDVALAYDALGNVWRCSRDGRRTVLRLRFWQVDPRNPTVAARLGTELPKEATAWPQIRFAPSGNRFAFFDQDGSLALATADALDVRVVSASESWPKPAEFFAPDERLLVVDARSEPLRDSSYPSALSSARAFNARVLDVDGREVFVVRISGNATARPLSNGDLLVQEGSAAFRILDLTGNARIDVSSWEIDSASVASDGRYVFVHTRDKREYLLPLEFAPLRELVEGQRLRSFTAEELGTYGALLTPRR